MTYEPGNVYCCDNLTLLAGLEDGCIDLILTSPPYDSLRSYKGYSWDFESIAHESYRVLKTGGVLVWVVNDSVVDGSETLNSFRQAIYFVDTVGFKMHDTMIWDKNSVVFPDVNRYYQVFEYMFVLSKGAPKTSNLLTQPNNWTGQSAHKRSRINKNDLEFNPLAKGRTVKAEGIMRNLWRIDTGFMKATSDTSAFNHPAIYPEELARRHILTWTHPGDIVLDYFAGSGTTLKMADIHDRRWLGCDIAQEYVDIAVNRIRSAKGIEKVLSDGSKQMGLFASEDRMAENRERETDG